VGSSKGVQGSKQEGVVIFSTFNGDRTKGYGFIEPSGANGNRSKNVFFGVTATQGQPVGRGDVVEFSLLKKQPEKGPTAHRVWVTVKLLAGADEV
jgi:cold shock CspA family protein